MADIKTEPSWKKFENFEGPDEDARTRALWAMRAREGHASNLHGGGKLTFGTPRKGKCRDLKFEGVRFK